MPRSNRLILDIPTKDDFKRYYEINSDPQTNLFNPKGPLTLETVNEVFDRLTNLWSEHKFGSWTIRLKDSEEIIGFGGLSYRLYGEELKLNLGYRFDKRFWGQGYATELGQFAISYGFSELKADKIFAIVRPKNVASIKVLEKCKMTRFGTLDDVPNEEESLVYIIEK